MSFFKKLFQCDTYGASVAVAAPIGTPVQKSPPQPAPAPANKQPLTAAQRDALRELGRKGGKARAAKRAAISATSPAAALAKSGEATP